MDAKPPLLVGVLAAITASLCCVVPLVLVTLGVGGAWVASLTQFEPLRPVFIAITLVMLFLAWRRLYQPASCTPDKVCADFGLQRRQRVTFWSVSALIMVLLVFPWFAPLFY
ncbi:MAG: mercuric transporter MerT family protein [Thiobacillus sp.]